MLILFCLDELEFLICGCLVIDFYEFEVVVIYDEGYNYIYFIIIMLWRVVNEMIVE